MSIVQIQEKVRQVLERFSGKDFIYDLLLAYNTPKATIARLQKGTSNFAKGKGEVLLKRKLYFKEVLKADLHASIDAIMHDAFILKFNPRFIIVTDYKTFLSVDTKSKDTLDIPFMELSKCFDFFLPWAGMEKSQAISENPVDIKAAYKMAKLYDLIRHDNPGLEKDKLHELNVFLSRLLFCFFAEDTEIFSSKLFSNSIASHTQEDGSDLSDYLNTLFEVLDAKDNSNYPSYLQKFPYVNGGLFGVKIKSPRFSSKSRKMIVECGTDLDWSAINPDIFGSMMQAVVHTDQRHERGMHYTSVVNIMKVIEPLFLNDLKEEFKKYYNDKKILHKLLNKLSKIKIFDPACGSGNFLIISYKEIRKLEIQIFKRLREINPQNDLEFSNVKVSQFYGIEIDDFAHEITILSLWLAEHQMNISFKKEFGQTLPLLPLKESGKIICGNATRLDWNEVCPMEYEHEVYVLGNPPYQGSRRQNKEQKADLISVCAGRINFKNLDYIACWLINGAKYIKGHNATLAFVSTNSICQGEQTALLWPQIFDLGIEIGFAYQSFKWSNNAKGNAGVTCVIINLRNLSNKQRYIFQDKNVKQVSYINAYLSHGHNSIINKRKEPLSSLPKMSFGDMPNDGGYLILEHRDYTNLLEKYPQSNRFIRKILGSNEFINGDKRWCLWIGDNQLSEALAIPFIRERINQVKEQRLKSKDLGTNKLAKRSHQFRDLNVTTNCSIIVPSVSSERRQYIPCGFVYNDTIIINSAQAIYDSKPYVFGVISSKMHNVWTKAVGGQLETRIRYSAEICYNNFPFSEISEKQEKTILTHVFNVIGEREKHSEKTISQLYDPDKMPNGLREAHKALDETVDRCYRIKPFDTDEERLDCLYKLYEEMIKKEKNA